MAIPNGAGGYQVGDGNLGEVTLGVSSIPTAYTAGVTLTSADLAGGLVVYTSASTADLALPAVSVVNTDISSAKVNSTASAGTSFNLLRQMVSYTSHHAMIPPTLMPMAPQPVSADFDESSNGAPPLM